MEWIYEESNVQSQQTVGNPVSKTAKNSESITQSSLEPNVFTQASIPCVTPQNLKRRAKVIVAPPPEKITALYELAMMGDIRGIQEQANLIEQLDEQFVPFAKQLCQLAKGFQEKQILEFVREYMAEKE